MKKKKICESRMRTRRWENKWWKEIDAVWQRNVLNTISQINSNNVDGDKQQQWKYVSKNPLEYQQRQTFWWLFILLFFIWVVYLPASGCVQTTNVLFNHMQIYKEVLLYAWHVRRKLAIFVFHYYYYSARSILKIEVEKNELEKRNRLPFFFFVLFSHFAIGLN